MFLIPARWQSGDETPFGAGALRALAALALLLPPLAVLAPKGLTWVALALALALSARDCRARRVLPHWPGRFTLIMAALVVWSGASVLWAVKPVETLDKLFDLAAYGIAAVALIGAGRAMTAAQRGTIARALIAGLILGFAILAVERLFGSPLRGVATDLAPLSQNEVYSLYNRGLAICTLLIWPAGLALWRAGRFAGAISLPIILAILAAVLDASSVLIGLAAAVIAAALTLAAPRLMPRLLAIIAVVVVLAHPFVANWAIDRFAPANRTAISDNISINHRIIIWEFVSSHILDRPFTGFGLNASRSLPGGAVKVDLLPALPTPEPGKTAQMPLGAKLSLHPHNAPLQLWLELGLPGALLGAALLVLLYTRAGAITAPRARALTCAQITAGACIGALAWGTWQVWWLAALALAAWLTLVMIGGNESARDAP